MVGKIRADDGNNFVEIGDTFGSSTAGITLSDGTGQGQVGVAGWGPSLRFFTGASPRVVVDAAGAMGINTPVVILPSTFLD